MCHLRSLSEDLTYHLQTANEKSFMHFLTEMITIIRKEKIFHVVLRQLCPLSHFNNESNPFRNLSYVQLRKKGETYISKFPKCRQEESGL